MNPLSETPRVAVCRYATVELDIRITGSDPDIDGRMVRLSGGSGQPILVGQGSSPAWVNGVPGFVRYSAQRAGTVTVSPITATVDGTTKSVTFTPLTVTVLKTNRVIGTYNEREPNDRGISGTTDAEVVSFWTQRSGRLVNEVKLEAQLNARPPADFAGITWFVVPDGKEYPPGVTAAEVVADATDPLKARLLLYKPGTYLVGSNCGMPGWQSPADWPVRVRVHAVAITGVRWRKYHNELSENPGSRLPGDSGAGLRMFAERKNPGDPSELCARVYVEAQIDPCIPNVAISFRGFDPDDPSWDSGHCDSDIAGDDNRDIWQFGRGRPASATKTTGLKGRARVLIRTPRHPGDNLIWAACTTKHTSGRLTQGNRWNIRDGLGNRLNADPDDPKGTYAAAVTRPLTIWRTGHIEVDRMENVVGNYREAVVERSELPTGDSPNDIVPETLRVYFTANIADPAGGTARFENGRMVEAGPGGRTLQIVNNRRRYADVLGWRDGGPPAPGARVILYDDDQQRDGAELPTPDTGLAQTEFRKAYIKLVPFDGGTAPFLVNYEDTTLQACRKAYRFDRAGENAGDYWSVYLLGAYQYSYDNDCDPDLDMGTAGVAEIRGMGASVFSEPLLEWAPGSGLDLGSLSRWTAAHEVGHIWGGRHADGGLMYDPGGEHGGMHFTPESISRLRMTETP